MSVKMSVKSFEEAANHNLNIMTKDFISALWNEGVEELAEQVLSYLDGGSLAKAGAVCQTWKDVIDSLDIILWKQLLLGKIQLNPVWKRLFKKQKEDREKLSCPLVEFSSYRYLYNSIFKEVSKLEQNWISGKHEKREKEISQLCKRLQVNCDKIFGIPVASRNEIVFWDRATLDCAGSVATSDGTPIYCFQCGDDVIMASTGDDCAIDQKN